MASQKADLHVQIVRFVMDHQPPIVACELVDSIGRRHTFIDKVWVFSEQTLDAQSEYPQAGVIRCAVLEIWRESGGRELVRINTADPFQIESTEGLSEFIVLRDQVSASSSPVKVRFNAVYRPQPRYLSWTLLHSVAVSGTVVGLQNRAEQQARCTNLCRTMLRCLVTCEENRATLLLDVTLEHVHSLLPRSNHSFRDQTSSLRQASPSREDEAFMPHNLRQLS